MFVLRMLFWAGICAAMLSGCSSPERQAPPNEPMSDGERQVRLEEDLRPMAERIREKCSNLKVGIPAFYSEGTRIEPRVGQYVVPILERMLADSGIVVLERRDLSRVLEEHTGQTSDFFDPDQVKQFGRMVGVDLLLLGTVQNLGDSYRLEGKLIDIESGRIVTSAACLVNKAHLPMRYGGI